VGEVVYLPVATSPTMNLHQSTSEKTMMAKIYDELMAKKGIWG
jgi:hypothetical protein